MSYDDIEIYVNKMNLYDYLNLDGQWIINVMPTKEKNKYSSEGQFSSDYLIIEKNNVEQNRYYIFSYCSKYN